MHITVEFYGNLNDFLPGHKRHRCFQVNIERHQDLKDIIESQGVPHVEVAYIKSGKEYRRFSARPEPGDKVTVYPPYTRLRKKPAFRIQPPDPKKWRFILDVHLGKLCRLMRMMGLDVMYSSALEDAEIARLSGTTGRILLTRDRDLLKRKNIKRGYWLREEAPDRQLKEVFKRYPLADCVYPFRRCLECNGIIRKVNTGKVACLVPARTIKHYKEFYQCRICNKIYWKGSHYENMLMNVNSLLAFTVSRKWRDWMRRSRHLHSS